MQIEDRERIVQALKEHSIEGRLPCALALTLAEQLKVDPRFIGEVASELGVKIVACQLGLFK